MSTTIEKSPIGEQDLNRWAGTSSETFTRETSAGYDITLRKIGAAVDVVMSYGGGVNFDRAAIAAALTAIGATNKVGLVLRPGTWDIDDDITITSNIALMPAPGCKFTVAAGKTATIQGPVMAGPYQWIYGTGTTTISTYPQDQIWWGNTQRTDFGSGGWSVVAGSYMHTITGNSLSANVSHYLPAVSGTLINSGLLTTQGDIIYASAANTAARLGKGTAGQVLTMNSGATAPEWQSGGKVAQIVETATTSEYYTNATIPLDNTIPQNTEGAELMTVSITPTNANSKLVVEVDLPITDIDYHYFIMALFKDSVANALTATFRGEGGQAAGVPRPMHMTYSMTAGGTSQITFRLRYGGANASYNVYVNRTFNSSSVFGGIARATLRVTEYLP